MTDEEKTEIRRLMENEQAEGAMRDAINEYRQAYLPLAMEVRGFYESMINVGFSHNDALIMVINMIQKIK